MINTFLSVCQLYVAGVAHVAISMKKEIDVMFC